MWEKDASTSRPTLAKSHLAAATVVALVVLWTAFDASTINMLCGAAVASC